MRHSFAPFVALVTVFLASAVCAAPLGPVEAPFVAVSNPPPVQMLIPGFQVRELPLDLNNINNLVCSPDGRIFALLYDGDVMQLTDTNATYFYKNDDGEIPPSIGMCWGPGGLYIASRNRIIRLRDKGDGTGALETVAKGWVKAAVAGGSALDTFGIAIDARSNIFFGLGCDAWLNPYLTNSAGGSGYKLNSERGTIQELSPDWKQRKTVATGLRFTVALAFNSAGDLFCTDQEGATWLPNGNPFDELLNIEPGRHYGFPPRHPKFLPNVIDEPSVFDYGPQHQSTCGLHFDDPVGGGTNLFGPSWWLGDAIVTGESRGKLWRTALVKTASGYVAQNNLIGCLSMLTIDAMPTPQGDLLVCCHSGKPDWGTGPEGKGKLFKISYVGKSAPQPVFAYAVSPTQFAVAFDRALDAAQFKNLASQSVIQMGRYVTAGNRFESFRPAYAAVDRQNAQPRYQLPVLSAGIADTGDTILLETTAHKTAVNYAITLPYIPSPGEPAHTNTYHDIDVLSDLTGVRAVWQDTEYKTHWTGWLPHLDLTAARAFTAPVAHDQELFDGWAHQRGILTLRASLDLWSMLHPAIQPGSKLDFEYPQERVTVIFSAGSRMRLVTSAPVRPINQKKYELIIDPKENEWIPVEIELLTGDPDVKLDVYWFTAEDPRPRALPLRRMFLPWARPPGADLEQAGPRVIPEIAGGDAARGKKIFFNETPGCYKCHQIHGEGGKIGPDLSGLINRDYASVLKDIREPSAAINPDYVAEIVTLKSGEAQTGVIVKQTSDAITLGQTDGKTLEIPRAQITQMKPSKVSLMPEGLLNGLTDAQVADLMTFLLTTPH